MVLVRPAEPISFLTVDTDGGLRMVYSREGYEILASGPDGTLRHLAFKWGEVLRNLRFMSRWIGRLDPAMSEIFDAMKSPPPLVTLESIALAAQSASDMFQALLHALPGTMEEKFDRMGRPPLLAHMCGARDAPLSPDEYALEVSAELTGRPVLHRTDGRSKAVWEPATGLQWPSAAKLAEGIGCAPISAYKHLASGSGTLRGRKFEYLPGEGPDPRSPANWTEARKEDERAKARALGFEPLF